MKLPKSVEITEVGPRDGFQNIKPFIPTEDKPRKRPEIPAMLKLNATDKTAFSIRSSLPSEKRKLTRQYPGTNATNV